MNGLTELPGRMEAFAQLEVAVNAVRAAGKRMVVALIDLDRFYRVNEAKGIEFGNDVLSLVSKRLTSTTVKLSTICRVGGNTFLIAMPIGNEDFHHWQAVESIKYAVEKPIDNEGTEFYLTSSIGATIYPQDGRTSEQLICRAESALHRAKDQGGNRTLFYNVEDTERVNRRIAIESALRPALHFRQFHISYQPIYRMADGQLRGFEALLRWDHPELGTISPNECIPIAEHSGLIVPIGEWVLKECCKTLASMTKCGLTNVLMSINLSPLQLEDASFSRMVLHTLEEFGLEADSIEFEITESVMIYSSDAIISTLNWLRAAGVRIALDHFGTGYSSLTHLQKLPIQCLKIHKSFVKKIAIMSTERIIVEGIIKLVQKLGLEVIAEGVEYEEQYNLLKEWGCDYVQGFLLGLPTQPNVLDLSSIRSADLARTVNN